ncbi:MAG: hypothetical protein K0U47_05780 [Epsilonproteobacteria bacterium]|nr:hypothetical protein [Campylobacterota bacterium]
MYQIRGLMIALVMMLSSLSAGHIKSERNIYNTNSTISINLFNIPHYDNDQDDQHWIGIYEKGVSNDWGNVQAWSWIDSGVRHDTVTFSGLPDGEYEARLFYHNSYVVVDTAPFSIKDNSDVNLYTNPFDIVENENFTCEINNIPNFIENWIGIYKKGDSNDWGNVVAWSWIDSTPYDSIIFDDISAGEYEARVFFNNSFDVENYIRLSIYEKWHGQYSVIYDDDTREISWSYNTYPKRQAWNSDSSMIFLTENGNKLLDATNFNEIVKYKLPYGETKWAHTNRDIIYHLDGKTFMAYSVERDSSDLIYDFSNDFSGDRIYMGPWEGNIDINDQYVALTGRVAGDVKVVIFNIKTEQIVATKIFDDAWSGDHGDGMIDWISMSQSGEFMVVSKRNDGIYSYRRVDLENNIDQPQYLTFRTEHGDIGYDNDNEEVYVQLICGGGDSNIHAYRLDGSVDYSIIMHTDDFDCSGHLSTRNYKQPGWAYVSSTALDEVYAVKLDGSESIKRLVTGNKNNRTQMYHFAVPSPDGTQILWRDMSHEGPSYVTKF